MVSDVSEMILRTLFNCQTKEKTIPYSLVTFEPNQDDVFVILQTTGQRQRIMFGGKLGLTMDEAESKNKFLSHYPETLEAYKDPGYKLLSRFLQGTQHDHKKCRSWLLKHQAWVSEQKPFTLEPAIETACLALLNQGFIYAMKRDRRHRPVIVMNFSAFKTLTEA